MAGAGQQWYNNDEQSKKGCRSVPVDLLTVPRPCGADAAIVVDDASSTVAAARLCREVARSEAERARQNRQTSLRLGGRAIDLRRQMRRARFDRHGAVVAMWSSESEPTPTTTSGLTLDDLVNRLFEAGLIVAGCMSTVDGAVAAKLDSVLDRLDSVIRDVRHAVLEAHGTTPSAGAGPSASIPLNLQAFEPVHNGAVVPLLHEVSETVEGLCRLAAGNDGQHEAAVALGEASLSLHRAVIAMDGADAVG
jgi:hypothetical protein